MKKYLDYDGVKYLYQKIKENIDGNIGGNPFDNMPVNTILSSRSNNIYGDKWCTYGDHVNLDEASPDFANGFIIDNSPHNDYDIQVVCSSNIIRSTIDSDILWFIGRDYSTNYYYIYERQASGYVRERSYNLSSYGNSHLCLFNNYLYFKGSDYYLYKKSINDTPIEKVANAPGGYDLYYGNYNDKLILLKSGTTYYSSDGINFSSKSNNVGTFYSGYKSYPQIFLAEDGLMHFFGLHRNLEYKYDYVWYMMDPDTLDIVNTIYVFENIINVAYDFNTTNIQFDTVTGNYYFNMRQTNSDGGGKLLVYNEETGINYLYSNDYDIPHFILYKGNIIMSLEVYLSSDSANTGSHEIVSFHIHKEGYYEDSFKKLTIGYLGNCGSFYYDKDKQLLYTLAYSMPPRDGSKYYSEKYPLYPTSPSDSIYDYVKYK